jgi:Tol biopolymer transport system component/tRNA A-37 threonylcarbamoyl transferase component Bud32
MADVDLRPGFEISGYRLEALIDRGGMGAVYRARDPRLGRPVAIKFVAPELAENEMFRRRFERESQMAAAIEHPNILPIYMTGDEEGLLYIVMRYVEGTNLRALIAQEGALEPMRILSILGQVAAALDTAHARGLVHRDVKPANILIAGGSDASLEHVYLTDFGLTKRVSSDSGLTGTGQFVGTLDYAAPEQFEGKPLDGRTDVYSLGCVLYESLTGEVPFPREQDAAVMYAHLQTTPPPISEKRPELSTAIDRVVAVAMAKRPQDRYQTCQGLVSAARRALPAIPEPRPQLEPGRFRPLRRPRQALTWIRRSRRRRWLAVAVAAIVVATAVILAVRPFGSGCGPPRLMDPNHAQIFTLRVDDNCVQPVETGPGINKNPVWSPKSDRILFVVDSGGLAEIYMQVLGEGGPTKVTSSPGHSDTAPAWAPNGSTMAFVSDRDGNPEIYKRQLNQSLLTRLTTSPSTASDNSPQWSPDGMKILFVSDREGRKDIFVMNADGTTQTDLTVSQKGDSTNPQWAPNGDRIVWLNGAQIWVMNADGTEPRALTYAGHNFFPSWSPNESEIAFFSDRDGNSDEFVMDADGSNTTNLTKDPFYEDRPTWSPDGHRIAFATQRTGGTWLLEAINTDGTGRTVLLRSPYRITDPRWSPDGSLIIFTLGGTPPRQAGHGGG